MRRQGAGYEDSSSHPCCQGSQEVQAQQRMRVLLRQQARWVLSLMWLAGFQDWAHHNEQPQVDVHRTDMWGYHGCASG